MLTSILLKSRTKMDSAAALSDFKKLMADPTDIAMKKYLASNFKTQSGSQFDATDTDILAGKYILSILTSLNEQKVDVKFRELMYYRAVGDDSSYKSVLADYEESIVKSRGESQ